MMNFARVFTAAVSTAALIFSAPIVHGQTPTTSDGAVYRGNNGHTGYFPTSPPQILSVLWQNTLPGVKAAFSTPALVDGTLYLGAGAHVYAINEKDGSIKWQYPADGSAASGNFNSPPAVADGKVFIGSDNDSLSVFDASKGSLLWQINTSGYVSAAPIVADGIVFFGSSDRHLYAISESDQQSIWPRSFQAGGPILSSPTIDNDLLWLSDGNGVLYGVKKATGAQQWSYLPTGGVSVGSPVYRDGVLYAASGSSIVTLYDRSGDLRSTIQLPSTIISPPTITSTNIFATTSNSDIFCMTLRGLPVWHIHLQDIVTVPLEITDTYLYAVSRSGVIYAIDPSNGKIVWSYAQQNAIIQPGSNTQITKSTLQQATTNCAPLIQDGKIFAFTNDGTLTALTGTATDHLPPQVLSVYPQPDSTVAGSHVQFECFVTDVGSGVDPTSVKLSLDGAQVPVIFDPTFSLVSLQFNKSPNGISVGRIVLPTLPDGQRTAILQASDWRGNTVTKTWSFTVDNTLDDAGSPPPVSAIGPNTFEQGNSSGSTFGAAPGAGSVTYPGGGGPVGQGSNGSLGGGANGGGSSPIAPPITGGPGKIPMPPPPPI